MQGKGVVGWGKATYIGEAKDFTVKPVRDRDLLLIRNAIIMAQALQELVLNLPDIQMIRDLAQEQLPRLAANARGKG